MAINKAGRYFARLAQGSDVFVVEQYAAKDDGTPAGGLCLKMVLDVWQEGDTETDLLYSNNCLVSRADVPQKKTLETLVKIFNLCDASEIFIIHNNIQKYANVIFEVTVEMDTWNGKMRPKVQWINVLGEGGGLKQPRNQKEIAAKFGTMFRALTNGQALAPEPVIPTCPGSVPSRPKGFVTTPSRPPASAAMMDSNELWAATANKYGTEANGSFFAAIDKVKPGADVSQLSPSELHRVAEILGIDISETDSTPF